MFARAYAWIVARIAAWLIAKAMKRPPDAIIGGKDNPYLLRWWLWPRNRLCNAYLHCFKRSDDDRALHDHPWVNMSIVLTEPGYTEVMPKCPQLMQERAGVYTNMVYRKNRKVGSIVLRGATNAHRLELHKDSQGNECEMWSLFLTGRLKRTWGFWCPKGWRKWTQFVENSVDENGQIVSKVGRGCE